MKQIIGMMLLTMSIHLFAIEANNLTQAHQKALQIYKSKDKNITKILAILQDAGVDQVLKEKPEKMGKEKYIQLLNDYAFFLQRSADFDHNVTLVLNGFPYVSDKKVHTDERYLESDHIKNFDQKVKNLCKAVNYLDETIKLSPKRSSAYLNLADTYWRLYLYRKKIFLPVQTRMDYVKQTGCKSFKKGDKELNIFLAEELLARKSYLLYKKYAKLMQEKNQTAKIPKHVKDFIKRPKRYIVISDLGPATGDATVCKDLQKAFDRFDCLKCKDNTWEEISHKRLWFNKSIFELNPKFSRVYDKSINKYFYKDQKLLNGYFLFKHNNNIYNYVLGNYFRYCSKRMTEEGGQRTEDEKCRIEYLNLKQKLKWENEL
jgi:hypothetical protein